MYHGALIEALEQCFKKEIMRIVVEHFWVCLYQFVCRLVVSKVFRVLIHTVQSLFPQNLIRSRKWQLKRKNCLCKIKSFFSYDAASIEKFITAHQAWAILVTLTIQGGLWGQTPQLCRSKLDARIARVPLSTWAPQLRIELKKKLLKTFYFFLI